MRKLAGVCFAVLIIVGTWSAVEAESDEAQVRQAVLDYCESWYSGDAKRMEGCLHPELAKRVIRNDKDTGRSRLDDMGAMRLVQYCEKGYGKKTPEAARQKDIEIFDIYENVATAKATMAGWIDYLQLGRVNDKWVIINVLWEPKPKDDDSGSK
jgi:hypothetical protein